MLADTVTFTDDGFYVEPDPVRVWVLVGIVALVVVLIVVGVVVLWRRRAARGT